MMDRKHRPFEKYYDFNFEKKELRKKKKKVIRNEILVRIYRRLRVSNNNDKSLFLLRQSFVLKIR